MSKIDLPNITLVSVTSIRLEETILAIKKSCRGINFGAVKLFTDVDVEAEGIEVVKVPKMDIVEYNRFVIYELYKYIDTDFALQIQSDGYVVNPEMWRDDFLDYDYIGAPWGFNCFYDRYGEPIKVGNGISIRSKKLMEIPDKYKMPWIPYDGNYNEDAQICIWNRNLFLHHVIKFAPFDVAKYFSHEEVLVESFDENGKRTLKTLDGVEYGDIKPFCFHNFQGGENNAQYRSYE
jgi:Protein of unknown function (DUF5672)